MIESPLFWASAILAVIITGISKGGFGGLALFAVPIMALTISPIQAASIMLPILILMDWVSGWNYRKHFDKKLVFQMLPAAILGIGIGWALAGYVTDDAVRIIVGVIAVAFPLYNWFGPKSGLAIIKDSTIAANIAGGLAGFTSFIAHSGGPPFQAYAIPQGLPHRIYAGSAVMFFFIINAVKLVPYSALGQLDVTNLTTSALLLPIAPIGVLLGVWMTKRIDGVLFYRIIYTLIFLTGLKLLWDAFL